MTTAEVIIRYPILQGCQDDIQAALDMLIGCYRNGGKVLLCGNGGSASDCGHITGELMKGFLKKRPITGKLANELEAQPDGALLAKLQGALPAIDLTVHNALIAAFANDVDAGLAYAQQVVGYGKQGDVLIAISTSGNAKNVQLAAQAAHAVDMKVLGLSGGTGGGLLPLCDVCICVPAQLTHEVQELHLPVYHMLCAGVEAAFFDT